MIFQYSCSYMIGRVLNMYVHLLILSFATWSVLLYIPLYVNEASKDY